MRKRGWKDWVAAGSLVAAGALAGSAAVRVPDAGEHSSVPRVGQVPEAPAPAGLQPGLLPSVADLAPAPARGAVLAVEDAVRSAVSLISAPVEGSPTAGLLAGAPRKEAGAAKSGGDNASLRPQQATSPCTSIGLDVVSEPGSVRPGGPFAWVVTVKNPNDRVLQRVSLDMRLSATPGTRFEVTGTSPPADSQAPNKVSYDDVGPISAGGSITTRVSGRAVPGSSGGNLVNEAMASGECQPGRSAAEAVEADTAEATVRHEGPAVRGPLLGAAAAQAPKASAAAGASASAAGPSNFARTGGVILGPALGLIGAGVVLRRSGRRLRDV